MIISSIESPHLLTNEFRSVTLSRCVAGIRKELETITIYPDVIPKLAMEIKKRYQRAQIQPGESVGILTAESVGEKLTQLTLNSFHFAGQTISTVVTGVPRLLELLNASQSQKRVLTTVYPAEKMSSISEIRNLLHHQLIYTTFNDVVLYAHYVVQSTYELPSWYHAYKLLYVPTFPENANVFIKYEVNASMVYQSQTTLFEIAQKIEQSAEDNSLLLRCVASPIQLMRIDIWFDQNEVSFAEVDSTVREVAICGTKNIDSVEYDYDSVADTWRAKASGSNFAIYAIPDVNPLLTYSNDVWDVVHALGIEAGRDFLIEELTSVISVDSYINKRHVELLIDAMTFEGTVRPINRYGMTSDTHSVIARASFEEMLDQFLQAASFTQQEPLKGSSSCVATGNAVHAGTGKCELLYSEQFIQTTGHSSEY